MSNFSKLTIVGISIIVLNTLILSNRFLGFQIFGSTNAFQTAIAVTIMFISMCILLFSIHRFYFQPPVSKSIKELNTYEDLVVAFGQYQHSQTLKEDILYGLDQENRLKKKKETLQHALNTRFEVGEMTYNKFMASILAVEKLFYDNIKNMLYKVSVFDESEYKRIINQDRLRYSESLIREKKALYDDYLSFLKNRLHFNEEILLDLDKLLVEISQLNIDEIQDIDELECMKEIQALINQTKYYKH